VLGSPSSPYRAAKAAGLLERGFHRGPLTWLSPSLGTVDSLQPVSASPPDLRDEMCGPHRKRPAAEDADDDGEPSSLMLSNLPPSSGKASALLKEKPDTVQAIAVFIGAAKNAAEAQFASARAKIQKLAKGKKADSKAATAAAPAATDAKAATANKPAAAPALQTATAPSPGPSNQPRQATRKLPAATDTSNPALSYAPAAKTDPAPLTAMPDAKSDTKPAAAAAAKPKPKADAKPAAAKQTAKPTAPAKPAKQAAAPKQDAAKQ
jgi:D-alanyl-D-alanine carboxypeptidase